MEELKPYVDVVDIECEMLEGNTTYPCPEYAGLKIARCECKVACRPALAIMDTTVEARLSQPLSPYRIPEAGAGSSRSERLVGLELEAVWVGVVSVVFKLRCNFWSPRS